MPDRDEITLRAMRFHPRVGILPHEQEFSQPLEVDLTVWTTARDAAGPLEYFEHVAADIVEAARRLDGVIGARAAVRKPHVALPGPLLHAEVVVERGRRE